MYPEVDDELQTLVEGLSSAIVQQKPFAFYSLPGKDTFHCIIGKQSIQQSYFSMEDVFIQGKTGYIFAPFDRPSVCLFIEQETSLEYSANMLQSLSELPPLMLEKDMYSSPSKADYLAGAKSLISLIQRSDIDKAVLSRKIRVVAKSNHDVFSLYSTLIEVYPTTYTFLVYVPGEAVWIGATPEILLLAEKSEYLTVSLAGTKKTERLEWTAKEFLEQDVVTQYIHDIISQVAKEGSVQIENRNLSIGNLHHLATYFRFEAEANVSTRYQIIKSLHPTPATAGYPVEEAIQAVSDIERYNREYYTGYQGIVSPHHTSLYVTLRCIKVAYDSLFAYAGGGLVAVSDPEAEWEETENKAALLIRYIS